MFRVLSDGLARDRLFWRVHAGSFARTAFRQDSRLNAFLVPRTPEDQWRMEAVASETFLAKQTPSRLGVLKPRNYANEHGDWKCSLCGAWLPLSSFYKSQNTTRGFTSYCQLCKQMRDFESRCTLRGYAQCLLRNARRRTGLMIGKGREGANRFDLDLDNLLDMYIQQGGRCAYSGVVLTMRPFSHWQGSLERIAPSGGYTVDNVAWIAFEFQTRSQWSKNQVYSLLTKRREGVRMANMWRLRGSLKMMEPTRDRLAYELQRRLGSAVSCARRRRLRGRRLAGTCDVLLDDLVDMVIEQKSLCAISGIPMSFDQSSAWSMSLERFDNAAGYVQGNCGLICACFQSTDLSCLAAEPARIQGSPQWTSAKFDQLCGWLESNRTGL